MSLSGPANKFRLPTFPWRTRHVQNLVGGHHGSGDDDRRRRCANPLCGWNHWITISGSGSAHHVFTWLRGRDGRYRFNGYHHHPRLWWSGLTHEQRQWHEHDDCAGPASGRYCHTKIGRRLRTIRRGWPVGWFRAARHGEEIDRPSRSGPHLGRASLAAYCTTAQ
jgi:hypothetical protein